MRHGRKSKSKRFNGYKRHIAADIDTKLILSCAVTPANRPEEEAAPELERDIQRQGLKIDQLHIDRGYINASTVPLVLARGGQVLCKQWIARNSHAGLFTKNDSHVDMRRLTITCPAGQTDRHGLGASLARITGKSTSIPGGSPRPRNDDAGKRSHRGTDPVLSGNSIQPQSSRSAVIDAEETAHRLAAFRRAGPGSR